MPLKNLCPKKICGPKKFVSQKYVALKNLYPKICGPKKFVSQKYVALKICAPKKFMSQKNWPKKFLPLKYGSFFGNFVGYAPKFYDLYNSNLDQITTDDKDDRNIKRKMRGMSRWTVYLHVDGEVRRWRLFQIAYRLQAAKRNYVRENDGENRKRLQKIFKI